MPTIDSLTQSERERRTRYLGETHGQVLRTVRAFSVQQLDFKPEPERRSIAENVEEPPTRTSPVMNRPRFRALQVAALGLLALIAFPQVSRPQAPVYEMSPVESSITFNVDSSVAIKGTFKNWDATLTFQSRELSTGVLDIKIKADSVDTGSGLKNGKLRGKDFFNSKENPDITFRSTKITQTGPETFELDGDFTIRGVTKKEKLLLNDSGKGTPSGTIIGTMGFDRKDYGMNSGIPFIKIANRVQVSVNLRWRRVSGPPPAFEQ